MRTNRWLLGLTMSVTVVALAACGGQGDDANPQESSAAAEQSPGSDSADQAQQGKPNTQDIPEVVAEVNGEKITKADFVPLFETQYMQMQMQAQQSGQPVDEEGLKEVISVLQAKDAEEASNWSRRYKANLEKLASGDVLKVAEVVRDLWRRDQGRGLSAGEKRMLAKARQILTSELALAKKIDEEEAEKRLDDILSA